MGARLNRWLPVVVFAVVAVGAVVGSTITAPSGFGPVVEAPYVFLVVAVPLAFWLLAARPSRDRARSRPELVVLWVLPLLFGGLFVWSQLRPGVFAPPIEEWAIVCALVGIGLLVVALARELYRGPPRWELGAGVGLVLSLCAVCCGPGLKYLSDDPYDDGLPAALLESHARTSEWSPLPAGVSVSAPPCFNLGAHGMCHDVRVMAPTDGSTRDQLVDRVIANYRASGWPLVASRDGESYEACRPVAGILRWGDHCMRVVVKEGSDGYIGAPDVKGAVNVYIDAAQGIDAVPS